MFRPQTDVQIELQNSTMEASLPVFGNFGRTIGQSSYQSPNLLTIMPKTQIPAIHLLN